MHWTIAPRLRPVAVGIAVLLLVSPAAGQQGDREVEFQSFRIPGWSFTPSIAIGTVYDSNVALSSPRADRGDTQGDTVLNIVPAGQLKFLGKHTEFAANYGGFLRRYRTIDGLEEFAQRASLSFKRTLSRRLTLLIRDSYADSPTTDDLEVNGVPFRRAGSQTNTFAATTELRVARHTELSTRYDVTWVAFDHPDEFLTGGWIHALHNDLTRTLNSRVSLGAEYSYRTASIDDGARDFGFQDAGGVLRFTLGPHTTASTAAGFASLNDRNLDETRWGPYARLGITHALEHATTGVAYERHYVPSFGFGGASSSQELRGHVTMPLGRNRVYTRASAAWRRTSPFEVDALQLDTIWIRSTVGLAATRWARVEGTYTYTQQDSIVTGGEVDRHRIGVQLVISQPIRIR